MRSASERIDRIEKTITGRFVSDYMRLNVARLPKGFVYPVESHPPQPTGGCCLIPRRLIEVGMKSNVNASTPMVAKSTEKSDVAVAVLFFVQ